jgi:sugar phosphate isomerase/epimerase
MPVPAIFKTLAAMGYKGNVDLEYEIDDTNPMPGVVKSFAYMRGVIAGLGLSK